MLNAWDDKRVLSLSFSLQIYTNMKSHQTSERASAYAVSFRKYDIFRFRLLHWTQGLRIKQISEFVRGARANTSAAHFQHIQYTCMYDKTMYGTCTISLYKCAFIKIRNKNRLFDDISVSRERRSFIWRSFVTARWNIQRNETKRKKWKRALIIK